MTTELTHAARVAAGLAMPGLLLLLTGEPNLIMYAVFGSFTGMYGRGELPFERVRHQLHAAGMLVTGVAIGSLLSVTSAPAGVLVPVVTAFATVGSLVTDRLRLRPGGPFFGIFALGACATVHPEGVSAWVTVAICAGTAVYCIALGLVISVASALLVGAPDHAGTPLALLGCVRGPACASTSARESCVRCCAARPRHLPASRRGPAHRPCATRSRPPSPARAARCSASTMPTGP